MSGQEIIVIIFGFIDKAILFVQNLLLAMLGQATSNPETIIPFLMFFFLALFVLFLLGEAMRVLFYSILVIGILYLVGKIIFT